jgi:DNA-binding MarR family transcriptional regulator
LVWRQTATEEPKAAENAIRSSCESENRANELLCMAFEGIIENEMSDLTMRQMAIFMNVSRQDGMVISELAKRLNVPLSSISRSVDVLTTKGVVKRDRQGRNVHIYMTHRGWALVGRTISSISRHL